MDGDFNYRNFDDVQLCQMVERIDHRTAPLNFANLKLVLEERGYIIRQAANGLFCFAALSAERREALIGSRQPLSIPVRFSPSVSKSNWLEPARNDFRLVGSGQIDIDGLSVSLKGRRFGIMLGALEFLFKRSTEFPWGSVANVEVVENSVRFEVSEQGHAHRAATLWLRQPEKAPLLARALPVMRTPEFVPKLAAQLALDRVLVNRSSAVPVTQYLIIANVLMFIAMGIIGGGWLNSSAATILAWGSNYAPYTTDGDWWRLLTALFIHLGVLHLAFNMWALASFGPIVERVYGSMTFLFLYLFSGVMGGLVSVAWSPVNSVGASGAILGILGALVATRFHRGDAILGEYLRPVRTSTFIFAATAVVSGLTVKGVDNVAHIAGFASGFLLGLTTVRPLDVTANSHRMDWMPRLRALGIVVALLGVAVALAIYRAQFLDGDARYYHEVHWFTPREVAALHRYKDIGDRYDQHTLNAEQFANAVESEVIPFWTEAARRLYAVKLSPESALSSRLLVLRQVSEQRVQVYSLCAKEIRLNTSSAIADCNTELRHIDSFIKNWKSST